MTAHEGCDAPTSTFDLNSLSGIGDFNKDHSEGSAEAPSSRAIAAPPPHRRWG